MGDFNHLNIDHYTHRPTPPPANKLMQLYLQIITSHNMCMKPSGRTIYWIWLVYIFRRTNCEPARMAT